MENASNLYVSYQSSQRRIFRMSDTFLSVMALEEMAYAMDSPGLPEEQLGATKLPCGHRFCRKDLSIWTTTNNTCPTCRAVLPIPAHPLPAITDVESIIGSEDIESIRQMQTSLEAASRLTEPQAGSHTRGEAPEGTPFTWQVHSGGPEYEYEEDRESFGMYS
ncbi:hypothetical protein FRB93_005101 [Tulasnella sp. JGI-2019a]|nr:hypothetical protein FRB93_005101 [Tulasnella sp. JGI-2019a]